MSGSLGSERSKESSDEADEADDSMPSPYGARRGRKALLASTRRELFLKFQASFERALFDF